MQDEDMKYMYIRERLIIESFSGESKQPSIQIAKPFSTVELTDFTLTMEHFEEILESIIITIIENEEMKKEVEKLDEMARWEAVGKLSQSMTDTLSAFGTPKNLMMMAFQWFGMQEGVTLPSKKIQELLVCQYNN
jgi:hypothetical protein